MTAGRMDPSKLLDGLTAPQREAVTHGDAPLLVLAGPGSGKTRVITHRAAWLARTVTEARHVLAITFTNKAAEEMAQRIAALDVGPEMTVCTFHSFCARLLRRFADRAGITASFSIFDQADRITAIKDALKRADFAEANFPPARIEARISRLKNAMRSPADATRQADDYADRFVAQIYETYEEVLAAQNALDFDDLLLRAARLLGEDAELRAMLEDQYRYVLVDEYQDTNQAQYLIARGLALEHHRLCVTGDPDQSIYGWRGANLKNILEFEEDFPDAKVVRLEQNYRSTKHILAAADRVISRNRDRKKKTLWTENPEGTPVRVVECEDAEAEAGFITEQITEAVANGAALQEIAIFYRINALTRLLEGALRQNSIPYRIIRGVEFYRRKEIKDLVAYLRVLINPDDETALLRIINTPARGIGQTTVERLQAHARNMGIPLMHCIAQCGDVPALTAAAAKKLQTFAKLLETLRPVINGSARDALQHVLDWSGLGDALKDDGKADADPLANVNELISAAAEYDRRQPAGSVVEWLHQISLVSDQDAYDPEAGTVTLMTLHAAKGLEFPRVFIAGCEDGLLPHHQHREKRRELEEERRLFFVGMTRAMEQLTLTYARYRQVRGVNQRMGPSPFLREVSGENAERTSLIARARSQATKSEPRESQQFAGWHEGQYVVHPSYGIGQVMWIRRYRENTRAGIRFAVYGEKVIILEYSKLKPVDVEADD